MISDGCTGWQWLEPLFPAMTGCCVVHDGGGSDDMLFTCLSGVFPHWLGPIVVFLAALTLLFRPLYHLLFKRKQ